MMKNKKLILLLSSFIVFPFTFLVFKTATGTFGAKNGYLLGFVAYWSYVLLFTWIVVRTEKGYLQSIIRNKETSLKVTLFNIAAFLPVIGVFIVSFLPNIREVIFTTGVLILSVAIVNGIIEEIYWRGLYLKEYRDNVIIGFFLSTLLFAIWHISLWYAKGIVYHGGFFSLVGGAYVMGMLWCYVSRKVQNIKYCIIAHILVNVFAFTGHFVQNGIGV